MSIVTLSNSRPTLASFRFLAVSTTASVTARLIDRQGFTKKISFEVSNSTELNMATTTDIPEFVPGTHIGMEILEIADSNIYYAIGDTDVSVGAGDAMLLIGTYTSNPIVLGWVG